MFPSKITPPLYCLLCLLLLLQTTVGDDDPQLYYICSSKSSSNPNLDKLLSTLSSKAPPTGFATASRDQTYGLALCRGDVSSSDCKSCVSGAATAVVDLCPNKTAGIVWYDFCLLKFSDSDFFGQVDYKNKFYLYNVMNISRNPELFTQKVREMLTGLSKVAVATPKLYAATEENLDTFTTLYGLVQCTRDLSSGDCKRCLDEAVSELGSCCDGKQGGRVVGGSCNFRYEIYPFVES